MTHRSEDPIAWALYLAAHEVRKETLSRARRVPTDRRERAGYRRGLRWASRRLVELAVIAEAAAVARNAIARDAALPLTDWSQVDEWRAAQ